MTCLLQESPLLEDAVVLDMTEEEIETLLRHLGKWQKIRMPSLQTSTTKFICLPTMVASTLKSIYWGKCAFQIVNIAYNQNKIQIYLVQSLHVKGQNEAPNVTMGWNYKAERRCLYRALIYILFTLYIYRGWFFLFASDQLTLLAGYDPLKSLKWKIPSYGT